MRFPNLLCDNNFECESNAVRKVVHAYKSLYRGRFSYFLSHPGRHSFVVLPRATHLSPILG